MQGLAHGDTARDGWSLGMNWGSDRRARQEMRAGPLSGARRKEEIVVENIPVPSEAYLARALSFPCLPWCFFAPYPFPKPPFCKHHWPRPSFGTEIPA